MVVSSSSPSTTDVATYCSTQYAVADAIEQHDGSTTSFPEAPQATIQDQTVSSSTPPFHDCLPISELINVYYTDNPVIQERYRNHVRALCENMPVNLSRYLQECCSDADARWICQDPLRISTLFRALSNSASQVNTQQNALSSLSLQEGYISANFVFELPNGHLAIMSPLHRFEIWNLSQPDAPKLLTFFRDHCRLQALANGNCYALYRDFKTIKILKWSDTDDPRCIATLTGHQDYVETFIEFPNGQLVTASFDNTMKVWDLNRSDGQMCVATLDEHTGAVIICKALSDSLFISVSIDHTMKIWDLSRSERGCSLATIDIPGSDFYNIEVLPNLRIISCTLDETWLWDLSNPGNPVRVTSLGTGTMNVKALPNGQLVGVTEQGVWVWQLKDTDSDGLILSLLYTHSLTGLSPTIRMLLDGRVVLACRDSLLLFDFSEAQQCRQLITKIKLQKGSDIMWFIVLSNGHLAVCNNYMNILDFDNQIKHVCDTVQLCPSLHP